jgi:hypothetical protein
MGASPPLSRSLGKSPGGALPQPGWVTQNVFRGPASASCYRHYYGFSCLWGGGHCSLLLRAVAHQNSSVWSASRRGKCPSSCHSATDHIIGALYLSPWSCQCHCPLQVLLGCAFHSAASSNRILRTLSVPSLAPLLCGGGGDRLSACASIPCYLCVAVALAVSKALTSGHPRRSPAAWAAGAGGRRQRACGPLLSRPLPASQGHGCTVFLLVRILKPALATARHGRRNFFNLL